MKITYLRRQEIDPNRWDACIARSISGLPYAYSWYLDQVADGKWDALVQGDYHAVMPLPWNQKLLIFKQIYQPFFTQQLGIYSDTPLDASAVDSFLDAISGRLFPRILLHLNELNPCPTSPDWQCQSKTNLVLDLDKPYRELRKNYSTSLRQNLKKAEAARVQTGHPLAPQDMANFYRESVGSKIPYLHSKHYEVISQLIQETIDRRFGEVCSVQAPGGEVVAAGFFLVTGHRVINLFSSSNSLGRQLRAMHYLHDQMIRRYSDTAILYDFEGSSIPTIAEFFRSFGAENRPFCVLSKKSWVI
jgi:hypothetical protein